jgi:hypothetical protein
MTLTKTYYHRSSTPDRRRDERGEGVISAAIAVLVMAFLGVAMWIAFDTTFQHAAKHVNNQVNCIGRTSTNNC